MRLLIVGAGGVGGLYGAHLAHAGRDVTLLVRPARARQLAATGLRLIGATETIITTPKLVCAGAIDAPFDAVFLSVKAYSLEAALDDIAPAVGSATMIVPLLNGMRHLDVLAARFGDAAVLGGVSTVSSTLEADGSIRDYSRFLTTLVFGERAGGISPRVEALYDALAGTDFIARASPDIMQEMWRKWMPLAALGALNSLLRGNVGEIEAAGGAGVASRLYAECVAIATASGYGPAGLHVEEMDAMLTAPGSGLTASMYRDLVAGNRVEAEHIVGDLITRARARGVETPLLDAALTNLRVYAHRLAAS
jgi:2-dehydropantoate 2-reductase